MLEFRWSSLVVGLSLGVSGFALLAATSWWSPRARKLGGRTHWKLGWVVNGLGMTAIGASWLVLTLLKPQWRSSALAAIGVPLGLAGGILFFASARKVGRLKALARYSMQLDTTGPYALVRHPQALALSLLAGFLGLATGSIPLLLSLPLWVLCWFAYTWFEEELELVPVFGERYRNYRETTPRLWPRIPGWRYAHRRSGAGDTL